MIRGTVVQVLASLATFTLAVPEVRVGNTRVIGSEVTGLNQEFFGGIPFAEPPLGALRLKPPVPKTKLGVPTFDASNFGYSCLQAPTPDNPAETLSEDCLYLNIFRPSNLPKNASLPVLFWTYGGGYAAGSGSLGGNNPSAIIEQSVSRGTPIIYVSFNYRLGPLGFPQGHEANQRGALNLALKDQLAALQWVNENIGFFGGDKNKVTVFGESAGSIMISILYLNSPIAKYARGAIFESGHAATSWIFPPERRENSWQDFVAGVPSCASTAKSGKTFDCLKSANSSEIHQGFLSSYAVATEHLPFDPVIDGPGGLYPDYPSKLFARGHFARLPFIAGTNLDEGGFFDASSTFIAAYIKSQGTGFAPDWITSEEQLKSYLIANFSPPVVNPTLLDQSIDKIFKLYPNELTLGSPFNTGNNTFGHAAVWKQGSAILGDVWFTSLRRAFQEAAVDSGVKSYGYLFTEESPDWVALGYGVVHSSEIPFVFGQPPDTVTAKALSPLMIDYWISFAASLDPNDGKGLARPHWGQYTSKNPKVIQLNGANLTMIPDDFRKVQNDYLNSIPTVLNH